jgi:hypothetical protein
MTTLIDGPMTGNDDPAAPADSLAPTREDQVTIELDAVGVLSYAFAHNRVPVIRQVFIANSTGRPIEGVRLVIEVTIVDGVLNRPYVNEIGLLEAGLTPVSTANMRLDPARLADLEEQRPGTISARLTLPDGSVLARADEPVPVLAHNHWIALPENLQLSYESIAAYVMPNHPAIGQLLTTAHEIIGRRTGSPSQQGYLSDTAPTSVPVNEATRSSRPSTMPFPSKASTTSTRRPAGTLTARRFARRSRCSRESTVPAWTQPS